MEKGLAMRFSLFSNGQQVIDKIEEVLYEVDLEKSVQPIALVILDINMPILDGL